MRSDYFRKKAERCRLMMVLAMNAEVREQLRLWAHEFDSLAEGAERRESRKQRSLIGWGRFRRHLRAAAT